MDFLVSEAAASEPRGTVLVTHGFGEHAGRYQKFAERVSKAGFDVYRFDLEAHGKQAVGAGEAGAAGSSSAARATNADARAGTAGAGATTSTASGKQDGKAPASGSQSQNSQTQAARDHGTVNVARLIAQHLRARQEVLRQCRSRELCLFGHSLGGLVTLASSILDPTNIRAVAVTAPALLPNPRVSKFTAKLGRLAAPFFPRRGTVAIDPEEISSDRDEARAYVEDPLVFHGKVPLLTASSMLTQGQRVLDNAGLTLVPTLVLHSPQDQICRFEGSRQFVKQARAHEEAGISVQLREVKPAKHDLLHETYTIREEVSVQILNWYQQWA